MKSLFSLILLILISSSFAKAQIVGNIDDPDWGKGVLIRERLEASVDIDFDSLSNNELSNSRVKAVFTFDVVTENYGHRGNNLYRHKRVKDTKGISLKSFSYKTKDGKTYGLRDIVSHEIRFGFRNGRLTPVIYIQLDPSKGLPHIYLYSTSVDISMTHLNWMKTVWEARVSLEKRPLRQLDRFTYPSESTYFSFEGKLSPRRGIEADDFVYMFKEFLDPNFGERNQSESTLLRRKKNLTVLPRKCLLGMRRNARAV